jgi:hypothetical protein
LLIEGDRKHRALNRRDLLNHRDHRLAQCRSSPEAKALWCCPLDQYFDPVTAAGVGLITQDFQP